MRDDRDAVAEILALGAIVAWQAKTNDSSVLVNSHTPIAIGEYSRHLDLVLCRFL
jgi:hypothetical protein